VTGVVDNELPPPSLSALGLERLTSCFELMVKFFKVKSEPGPKGIHL